MPLLTPDYFLKKDHFLKKDSFLKKESPYITTSQAAAYLKLHKRTLENLRSIRMGPNYRKHGGKVFYTYEDLDLWSNSRLMLTDMRA